MDDTYAAESNPFPGQERFPGLEQRDRVSDPEADGVPGYADDESTAYDDVPSLRAADGRDPVALPSDREAGPMAVDDFGTTAEEQRQGEPLEQRLAREEPDLTVDGVPLRTEPRLADEATSAAAAGQVSDDSAILAEEPVDPRLGSPVSMYDRSEPGVPDTSPTGRLVRPDQGAHEDTEATEVAFDPGSAGGGASAEESAIHPVPPEELG